MIGIICDSANDISKDNLQKYSLKVAPIRIIIEGKEYHDGEEGCNECFCQVKTEPHRTRKKSCSIMESAA